MEQDHTNQIIRELCSEISHLFPDEKMEVILFGSYARGDPEEGSDVDVMLLVDSSREEIAKKNWQVGDAAGEILINRGILISPIVENRSFFNNNVKTIPLFKNVAQEGIHINV